MERGIPRQVPTSGASQQPYKEKRGCGDSQGHLFGVSGAWASAQGCSITPSPRQHPHRCPSLAPGASPLSQPQTGASPPAPKIPQMDFSFLTSPCAFTPLIWMRRFGSVTQKSSHCLLLNPTAAEGAAAEHGFARTTPAPLGRAARAIPWLDWSQAGFLRFIFFINNVAVFDCSRTSSY